MADVVVWTPTSAAQRFTAARTSAVASRRLPGQRLPGRKLAGAGNEPAPRSNTPLSPPPRSPPPKSTSHGTNQHQGPRRRPTARSISPSQQPAELARTAHPSRRMSPKPPVPGQGPSAHASSSTQTYRLSSRSAPSTHRSRARSSSPPGPTKELPDLAPVRALSARRVAAEEAARDKAALLASEPAFVLPVLTMSGSLLATLPGARAGWTRTEVVAALNEKAPPPAGKFYKLIANGRPLAGGLSLFDVGLAGKASPEIGSAARQSKASSADMDTLYAVVITNDALTVFVEARDGLQCIPIIGLDEITKLHKPPVLVTFTFQAVCVLLDIAPARAKTPSSPSLECWSAIRQELLQSPQGFLEKLIGFDADADPKGTCELLNPFVDHDDFAPEKVVRASRVAAAICQWCHALHTYCRVAVATGLA